MPSVTDISSIEATLKASLSRSRELDQNVASESSAQRVLLQKIEFAQGKAHTVRTLSSVKSRFIPLRPLSSLNKEKDDCPGQISAASGSGHRMNGPGPSGDAGSGMGESLPVPKVVLYPPEHLQLEMRKALRIGAGLSNLGNTCFMNSALQCLTYTAPLMNYCLSDEHPSSCNKTVCLMCDLRNHIQKVLFAGGKSLAPNIFFRKLHSIAKHFRQYRQEDAHEFLRHFLDGLQRACLNGVKLDKISMETTVVNQIFGGFLRSQVQCMKCSARSNTYDQFMDLSLDLKGAHTLEDALAKFVKAETLDADNAYKCEKCNLKVPAQKRFSIQKAPNVLTIQLNRFNFDRHVGKINRHVPFPERLDIRPYLSQRQGEPVFYSLYGLIVHVGRECGTGHYYCYVRLPNNVWYIMDDERVQTVPPQRVYGENAYVLFYSKPLAKQSHSSHQANHQVKGKVPLVGPSANGLVTHRFNGVAGKHALPVTTTSTKASNDLGVAVSRQTLSPVAATQSSSQLASSSSSATSAPLPQEHGKISFSLNSRPFQPMQNQMNQSKPRQDSGGGVAAASSTATSSKHSTPHTTNHICVRIERGKSTSYEKSPDGVTKVIKDSSSKNSVLVPYGSDSDSAGEQSPRDKGKKSCPRVALNFNNPEKENIVCGDKTSRASQGASNTFSGPSSPAKAIRKEKSESSTGPPQQAGKVSGADSRVSRNLLTLKLNRDHAFPLKKVSVDTVLSPSRSTTTSWFVQAKDPACSPSLGSCSSNNSNHSTNSTTEWGESAALPAAAAAASGKKPDGSQKKMDFPWKVSASSMQRKRPVLARSDSMEEIAPKPVARFKRSCSLEPLSKRLSVDYSADHDKQEGCVDSVLGKSDIEAVTVVQDSHLQSALNDQLSDRLEATDINLSSSAAAEELTEHCSSDKQPLLAAQGDSFSERPHKKKKKKHKKEKRLRLKYEALEDSIASKGNRSRHKHKKKKHMRECDHGDTEREKRHKDHKHSETDSEHSRKRRRHHHHNDFESVNEGSVRKRKKSESSDSSEYMWEERTKETVLKEKHDLHINLENSDTKDNPSNNRERREIPHSQFSFKDIRTPVTTWGGEKSQMDIETEKEQRQHKRKTWHQHYDDEIDSGKVKKVKQKKSEDCQWAFNPFQRYQNQKNEDKAIWREDGDSRNKGYGAHNNACSDSHHKPGSSYSSGISGQARTVGDQSSYRSFGSSNVRPASSSSSNGHFNYNATNHHHHGGSSSNNYSNASHREHGHLSLHRFNSYHD